MKKTRRRWAARRGLLGAALLAALAGLLAACGPLSPGTATPPPATLEGNGGQGAGELVGSEWLLTSLRGQAPRQGTQITLQFQADQLGGFAGCNAYGGGPDSGGYTASDGELRIPMLANTAMACLEPEGVMEQERRYLSWLRDAEKAQVHGRQLWLETGDGRALVFYAPHQEKPSDGSWSTQLLVLAALLTRIIVAVWLV